MGARTDTRRTLTALQVKRIDPLRRRLHVVRTAIDLGEVSYGTPKSHQQRWVPVPRSLMDALVEHVATRHPDELGFASPRGAPLRNHNFRARLFTPAAEAIGVPHLTPHDLRHTAASLAVRGGANVKAVNARSRVRSHDARRLRRAVRRRPGRRCGPAGRGRSQRLVWTICGLRPRSATCCHSISETHMAPDLRFCVVGLKYFG